MELSVYWRSITTRVSIDIMYSVLWVVFLLFCLIALSAACCVYLISSKGHVKLVDDINDNGEGFQWHLKVADVISKRFYTIAGPFNFGNSPNPDSQNKIGVGLLTTLYVCLAREWWSHYKLITFIISATTFCVSNRLSWLVIWNPIYFRIISKRFPLQICLIS